VDGRLQTLAEIEAAAWEQLASAAADHDHEWRDATLATTATNPDGNAYGDARTVILREVDADARRLLVYSDARAQKVAQLRGCAEATLLMWSRRLSWQLRCRVRCEVHEDGLAVASRWARIRSSPAAQDYLSPLPPGAPIEAQTPAVANREYFAMIEAEVLAIDWLELHREGHRRARFEPGRSRWLQP
jgi:pyridoxamine 5'-phosphate oxidase